jgi:NAD(P)-dependent dehydrogenase (short-subunit alcohol dehydrogenase family)
MPAAGTNVALVTGAGTGIGRAVSLGLAQKGYTLVLAGRRAGMLEPLAASIAQSGGRALALVTDLTDESAVRALFETMQREFGRLDLLFNNAGARAREVPMEELSAAEWRAVIDVNLTAAFLCAQQAILLMKRQRPRGGRIINNGSISAHTPRPGTAAYTATKHAITGLTKQTSLDCRAYDICCGQIDIGNAATPLTEKMAEGMLQADGSTRPESRMNVDDVGRAVVYMASLPLDANVLFMTVMANKMPFVGRG